MSVLVALLRGIGPASHAKMRPSALRERAEEAGLERPVNYLATGNLIFNSTKSVAAVRREVAGLVQSFGLDNDVFIVTRAQMRRLVDAAPFADAARERPGRLGICFFHATPEWPATLLKPEGPERVETVGPMLAIDYGPGDAPSKLNVEKLTAARMTQRNWNTVLGIWSRMNER